MMPADRIKELASDNVLMSAYLLFEESIQLKAQLALELQAAKDDRRAQHKEFQEFMTELRGTLRQIRAKHLIEAQLLDLIRPEKAGEDKWQINEGESNSSQSHMLKQFAKSTR